MAILRREEILEAQDLKRKTINVPEWGGEISVTEMSARRRIEFEEKLTEDVNHMRILITAYCVVDEAGEALFSLEDVEALGKKNWKAIWRISNAALRLNRVGAEQERELQENFTESQG